MDAGVANKPSISPFVVALALAVLKAKPDGTTVAEYLRNACRHLLPNDVRGIDSNHLRETTHQLQDELRQRYREIANLRSECETLQETVQRLSDGEMERCLLQFMSGADEAAQTGQGDCMLSMLKATEYRPMLHHIMLVSHMLNGERVYDSAKLASQLRGLCDALLLIVDHQLPKPDSQALVKVSTRAFRIMLAGLRRLAHGEDSRSCKSAECHVISWHGSMILLLQQRSQITLVHHKDTPASNRATRATTRLKERIDEDKQNDEHKIMLATLLESCLCSLDAKHESDRRIFEGFLSSYMLVIGRQLFKSTFGHDKQVTVEDDIRAVLDVGTQELPDERQETPLLVHLLERALAIAPRLQCRSTGDVPTLSLKRRLQDSLVRAIFGEQISEAIIPDPPSTAVISLSSQQDISMDQWFQREVWRTIGWDVLTS